MKKYKSKIGLELIIFISIVLIGTTIVLIENKAWAGLPIILAVIGLICYLFTSTYYILQERQLIIKSGFIYNETIDIEKIEKLKKHTIP